MVDYGADGKGEQLGGPDSTQRYTYSMTYEHQSECNDAILCKFFLRICLELEGLETEFTGTQP